MWNTILRKGYETDVTPLLTQWRRNRDLPNDPLAELRDSGIINRLARESDAARRERAAALV